MTKLSKMVLRLWTQRELVVSRREMPTHLTIPAMVRMLQNMDPIIWPCSIGSIVISNSRMQIKQSFDFLKEVRILELG
jgi:3-polyprenyl-4-hydroxybenzoate decarboxylase